MVVPLSERISPFQEEIGKRQDLIEKPSWRTSKPLQRLNLVDGGSDR